MGLYSLTAKEGSEGPSGNLLWCQVVCSHGNIETEAKKIGERVFKASNADLDSHIVGDIACMVPHN